MIKKIIRKIRRNPLDLILKKAKEDSVVLLSWNRGLGDIALGLYAICLQIYKFLPKAKIYFLIRENLKEGFDLLGEDYIIAPWKRYQDYDVYQTLENLKIDPKKFDIIVEKPDPTYWVKWQLGNVVPKLKWNYQHEDDYKKFSLEKKRYIGVQVDAETNYGLWRNWPSENWDKFFSLLEKRGIGVLVFGYGKKNKFNQKNVVDLRGKTTLMELLSIVKNLCFGLVLPDSGILSMVYYLNEDFPIKVISIWADPYHGILKQNVPSPNKKLIHIPLISNDKDLKGLLPQKVISCLIDV